MDDQESTYAPQSPDFSAYQASFTPDQSTTSYFSQPHPQYQASYTRPIHHDHQPHFGAPIPHQPSNSYESPLMPRNTKRHESDNNNDQDWSPEAASRGSSRKAKKPKVEEGCDKPAPGVEEGIEVKTKFPVARIKRIMQADEDIGKVAQVTPTAVSKALELFMISVVTKAAKEANKKSSKRVTAAHLKQACEQDDQWDFLASIMAKVPDAPQAKKDDDSEEAVEGKKKKGTTRRKKRESDEF